MPKRKFQKAFVDPISLIGITFLIITLTVGVSATNNPVKKFLIDSLAGGRVKSCDDYGSAAKRNACKDAQEETSDEAVVNQAYRNVHPNQYPVTDSKGNHLSNEQQIEILTKFASTANPDSTSFNDVKAMCPTCNNNTLRNYATNSLNSFYYDKTKINQIEAQYQQEVQAKAAVAATAAQAVQIAQQKEQARLENIRKTQIATKNKKQAEAEAAAQIRKKIEADRIVKEAKAKLEKQRLESIRLRDQKLAEKQRLAKLVQEQDIERIRLERTKTDRIVEDARLEANRLAQENNPIVPPTTTVPEDTSILSRIADKFNNAVTSTGLTELGTTGLGGGNATILPPPAEVIDTVKNPGGIYKYALENTISFGAGLATATVVTPGAPAFIMETALSNPLVQRVLPYVLWADFADSATAGVQCATSGDASSPACSAAVASVLAPPGAGLADDFADAMSTLRPRSPLNLNPLSINPNPTETLAQAITPSEMLFAPRDITDIPNDMARAIGQVDAPVVINPNIPDVIDVHLDTPPQVPVVADVTIHPDVPPQAQPAQTIAEVFDEKIIKPITKRFDIAEELNNLDTPITPRTPVADQITDWVSTTRNNITEAWNRNIINGPSGDTIFGRPVLENLDTTVIRYEPTDLGNSYTDFGPNVRTDEAIVNHPIPLGNDSSAGIIRNPLTNPSSLEIVPNTRYTTTVNGVEIKTPTQIQSGDIIAIDDTTFRVGSLDGDNNPTITKGILETQLDNLSDTKVDIAIQKTSRYVDSDTGQKAYDYYKSNFSRNNPEFTIINENSKGLTVSFQFQDQEYVIRQGISQDYIDSVTAGQRFLYQQNLGNNMTPITIVDKNVGIEKFIEGNTIYDINTPEAQTALKYFKDHGVDILDPSFNIIIDKKGIPVLVDKEIEYLKLLDKQPVQNPIAVAKNWVDTARTNIAEVWDRNIINGPIGDTILTIKLVQQNADLIITPGKNKAFNDVWIGESVGGNAGDGYSAVNGVIDLDGKIISFGNIQDIPKDIRDKLNTGKAYRFSINAEAFPIPNNPNPKYQIVYDKDTIPSKLQNVLNAVDTKINSPSQTSSFAYFKTGTGFNTPTLIISGIAAGYILEKTNIDEFITNLFTPDPESNTPISKLGKSVGESAKSLVEQVAPPTPTEPAHIKNNIVGNETLNNLDIFMQRDNDNGAPINPSGATLTSLGCGPSTAINVLRLTNHNPNPNQIIENFYWANGSKTSADATLLSLQQNGFSGAVDYGLKNRITDATQLLNYTGVLVYGGTVSSSTESVAHIAAFDCQAGKCYSIDSYFNSSECNIQNANSIKCGDINYNMGETDGTPDALYPVITNP